MDSCPPIPSIFGDSYPCEEVGGRIDSIGFNANADVAKRLSGFNKPKGLSLSSFSLMLYFRKKMRAKKIFPPRGKARRLANVRCAERMMETLRISSPHQEAFTYSMELNLGEWPTPSE